jgi:HEAT repeat protein
MDPRQQRKQDLDEQLRKNYEMLKDLQNALSYEDDPMRKAKLRDGIADIREQIAEQQAELDALGGKARDEHVKVRNYLAFLVRKFESLPMLPTYPQHYPNLSLEAMYISPMTLDQDLEEEATAADDRWPSEERYGSPFAESWVEPDATTGQRIPLTRMFAEYPYLVVLGDPGSGKTTFLNYMATTFARAYLEQDASSLRERWEGFEQILLPIHIPVKTFIEHVFNRSGQALPTPNPEQFLDFFLDQLSRDGFVLSPEFVIGMFRDGKCLFLLDGIDEGGSIHQRTYAAEAISSLRNAYPENRYVVTSRKHGYRALSGPFRVCVIQELEKGEKRALIRNWCRGIAYAKGSARSPDIEREIQENADRTMALIEANPSVRDLTKTPLLLTAIAVVHEFRGGIPSRRTELYQECTELLVGSRDIEKILTGRSTTAVSEMNIDHANERKESLERVGLWFQENEGYEFISRHRLDDVLRAFYTSRGYSLDRAQDIVDRAVRFFCDRGGILEEQQPDHLSFRLRVFQEYFAARAIIDEHGPSAIAYLRPHIGDRRWHNVIRLVAGHLRTFSASQAVRFVRALLDSTDTADPMDRRMETLTAHRALLAAECLIEVGRATDRTLHGEIVDRLARAFEGTRVHSLRCVIAETLGKLPEGIAISTLYGWSLSDDDEIRAAALRGLVHLPVECIPDYVISDLHHIALEKCLEPGIAGETTKMDKEIAYHATWGLARMARAREESGHELLHTLVVDLDSEEPARRQVAAQVLAQAIQDPAHEGGLVATLREVLWHASDRRVRWICSRGLARLGVGPDRPLSAADLTRMLGDEDWGVRAEAARAASTLDRAFVAPELLDKLLHRALWDDEREVLSAASTSLGRIAPLDFRKQSRQAVLSALKDGREQVRAAAARVFGQLGVDALDDESKRALIVRALEDRSDQAGYAAAKALARVGLEALKIEGENVRECFQDLLHAACGRAYMDELGASRLGPYTRSGLCRATSRIGVHLAPHATATALVRYVLLTDPVPELRVAAALAVEELGIEMIRDPGLLQALTSTIRDRAEAKTQEERVKIEPDSTVRATILRLLAQNPRIYGEERLFELACLAAREDEAREVRLAALQILGQVYKSGNETAREVLLFACEHDPDPVVRSSAYNALVQIEDPLQWEQIPDLLDETKARRAAVRMHLERMLTDKTLETSVLDPAQAAGVIEEIITSLRMNFQLQARTTEKPPEELENWVRVTDDGLTRMQLEAQLEKAVEKHVPDEQTRSQATALCAFLVQRAILDHFYVRPKPVGDILRRSEDWKRVQDETRAFCRYFAKEHMKGTDYDEAADRLRNARPLLRRLVDDGLEREPVSCQDLAPREKLSVPQKANRVREELNRAEPNPLLIKHLLEEIWDTPQWLDFD